MGIIKTFENFINERIDYLEVASSLIKHYGFNTKVKFVKNLKNKAEYDWDSDTIRLRTSYKTEKDFLITVLHEINHVRGVYEMGVKKYKDEYKHAGDIALANNGDFYKDNSFEIKAEDWAQREVKKWINKIK